MPSWPGEKGDPVGILCSGSNLFAVPWYQHAGHISTYITARGAVICPDDIPTTPGTARRSKHSRPINLESPSTSGPFPMILSHSMLNGAILPCRPYLSIRHTGLEQNRGGASIQDVVHAPPSRGHVDIVRPPDDDEDLARSDASLSTGVMTCGLELSPRPLSCWCLDCPTMEMETTVYEFGARSIFPEARPGRRANWLPSGPRLLPIPRMGSHGIASLGLGGRAAPVWASRRSWHSSLLASREVVRPRWGEKGHRR